MKEVGLRSDYVERLGNLCLDNELYVLPCDYFYELNEISLGDCFVLNLDNSRLKGSHYVGLFISSEGALFFDPLGFPLMNVDIKNGLLKHGYIKINYSKKHVQSGVSFHCGFFVIAFLIIVSKGKSMNEFISLFSDDDFKGNEQIAISIIEEQLAEMY